MSLKAWFARTTGLDVKYAPAAQALLEKHFGEIMLDFPIEGGHVVAAFKRPVYLGRETGLISMELQEPTGFGKTAPAAILSLFDQCTQKHPDLYILVYEGNAASRPPAFEYSTHQYTQHGRFIATGTMQSPDSPENLREKKKDSIEFVVLPAQAFQPHLI